MSDLQQVKGNSQGTAVMQEFSDDAKEIPRPGNWGGYVVIPEVVEFWHGKASRLHDRLRYTKSDAKWSIDRLSP